jgi:hypothetical protein
MLVSYPGIKIKEFLHKTAKTRKKPALWTNKKSPAIAGD